MLGFEDGTTWASSPTNKLTTILGIDTSTSILDVAIFTSTGEILSSFTSDEEKTHSERAMVAVDTVLKQANLTINDIDIFAACIGAGSYTGVRIGVAIAKGLAAATGKECKGISGFELMAHKTKGLAVPIIDARRGAVFAQIFQDGTPIASPERIDFEELEQKLSAGDAALGRPHFIEPHPNKWQGVTPNMLTNMDIIYLGGSV